MLITVNILVSEQREESYRRKPYNSTFMFQIFNLYGQKGYRAASSDTYCVTR